LATQKLKKENVEKALKELSGNILQCANRLGCSRKAVYDAVKRYELEPVLEECREEMVDIAENALHNLIRNEHASAIMFYLRTQGKSRGRGYVERQETTGADGEAIKIQSIDTPPRATNIEDWVSTKNRMRELIDDE
jgi:hypothetical protein|tara:strand:+ start:202 stop:612 length:411 start_codon:yes stop_codon:yes gene_type:complete